MSLKRTSWPAGPRVPAPTVPDTFTTLPWMDSPYPRSWPTVSASVALSYFEGHLVTSSVASSTPSSPTLPVQMAVTSLPKVEDAAPP